MIEVLWIDDECLNNKGELTNTGVEVIETAFEYGIKITPKLTYKEGIEAININPLKWCAVILDIHNQKSEKGKASDDFDKAREDIIRIQAKKNQQEPYIFVLSGNKQYQTESSTIRKPDYCQKNIYDKNGEDYKLLFEDIRKIEDVSDLYKLHKEYEDVINISEKFGNDGANRLIRFIYKIIIKEEFDNASLLTEFRKYIEKFIIPKLEELNFFPTAVENSLNQRSIYIGSKESNIPEYIKRSFHSIVSVTQEGSHGKTITDAAVRERQAPYLLRACLYELLNILNWMKNLV